MLPEVPRAGESPLRGRGIFEYQGGDAVRFDDPGLAREVVLEVPPKADDVDGHEGGTGDEQGGAADHHVHPRQLPRDGEVLNSEHRSSSAFGYDPRNMRAPLVVSPGFLARANIAGFLSTPLESLLYRARDFE